VRAGAGVALRSMARAPLRRVAVTVACGILLAWPARIAGALRFTSAEGHPRSGFLQVLTPGARPDNSEGSVSEP
jgi:hypothetical protein